jgi:cobaltochelatase CobN
MDKPAAPEKDTAKNAENDAPQAEDVEGLKMEDMNTADDTTELTSSGVQWAAAFFVLVVLGLFGFGLKKRR